MLPAHFVPNELWRGPPGVPRGLLPYVRWAVYVRTAMSIEHRPEESRFVALREGIEAELTYRKLNDATLEYDHTYVPPEFRGGGLGGRLVREAMEYARKNGYKVKPTCPFVADFIDRHPEYQEVEATW